MKKNPFTNILANWKNWDENEKYKALQELEDFMSKFYNRPAREVRSNSFYDDVEGFYTYQNPNVLFLTLSKSAISAIFTTVHEGIHAYFDDFVNDRTDLKCFSYVNRDYLVRESRVRPILMRAGEDYLKVKNFNNYTYEEYQNYKEGIPCIMFFLINSCENVKDYQDVFSKILYMFDQLDHIEEDRKKMAIQGVDYDKLLENAEVGGVSECPSDFRRLYTRKTITNNICPNVYKLYKLMHQLFGEYKKTKSDLAMYKMISIYFAFVTLNELELVEDQPGGDD